MTATETATVTPLVIVGGIVLSILYDLVAYWRGGDRATISRTMLSVSQRYPLFAILFALVIGVLLGHFFLPQHVPLSPE